MIRRNTISIFIAALAAAGVVHVNGCKPDSRSELNGEKNAGGDKNEGGEDTNLSMGGDDGSGGEGGTHTNPCGTECGPEELCDGASMGLDDNCDGEVDEGCPCNAGAAQACFKGDPSYRDTEGCFPGTMKCTELGTWGPCAGGVHATEACYENSTDGCHAISGVPFVTTDISTGIGDFGNNATSDLYEVACPAGVDPCPAVQNVSDFTALQSGEYMVTYTKTTASGDETCQYPLFIGARGLRVELVWEHPTTDSGVDLDLHVHKPNDTFPWGGSSGNQVDCAYDNCTAGACTNGGCPFWFNAAAPPDPVQWYKDPVVEGNSCYFGPNGSGAIWEAADLGCHNPRLDSDNISCDATITDPDDGNFCNPENINIDFPPTNEWTRIGVHYYSAHGLDYDVHPTVKIFCHGKLAAELGPSGYFSPESPVVFKPQEGSTRFWMVADVAFVDDGCDDQLCVVEPLYQNPGNKTPYFTTDTDASVNFGPAYPPAPGMP